jgi:hypothetical protein
MLFRRRDQDMGRQRKLTAGEIALASAAFGNKIVYKTVKLSDGPGLEPLAYVAFAKGNPAITVGQTIYFKQDYSPDFSAAPMKGKRSFIHEMTHVWQYAALGMPAFFARYGRDLAKAKGRSGDMYKYVRGTDPFGKAMLEAQAEMVSDYSVALWSANAAKLATLAKNMKASGLYGL